MVAIDGAAHVPGMANEWGRLVGGAATGGARRWPDAATVRALESLYDVWEAQAEVRARARARARG